MAAELYIEVIHIQISTITKWDVAVRFFKLWIATGECGGVNVQ